MLVDYTNADVVKANVLTAIGRGGHVVIGSSGLTDDDFEEINQTALKNNVGVIAGGISLLPQCCYNDLLVMRRNTFLTGKS